MAETSGTSDPTSRASTDGKPAVEIDLPASDVKEIPVEAPAEAGPPAETEPPPAARKPSSARLVPAVIGLVAGLAGGVGGYTISDFSRPKSASPDTLAARLGAVEQSLAAASRTPPAALPAETANRIAKAEASAGEAEKRVAALAGEVTKLRADLTAERARAVEALANRAPGGAPGVAPAELSQMKSRLDALDGVARALPQSLATLKGRIDAIEARLGGLSANEAIATANARLAAVTLLDEAMRAGAPLAPAAAMLKNLGADAAGLGMLAPFAETGAPGAARLLDELRALRPAPQKPAADTASLLERMRRSAMSLVEIRRTGEVTGTDDAAHLARAEQSLARGDIATAVTLVGRLSPSAAPAYAAWRARADARVKAADAIAALRRDAYAALAKAASPAK